MTLSPNVIDPVRDGPTGFGATLKANTDEPVPPVEFTAIHGVVVQALHAHAVPAVENGIPPVPPAEPKEAEVVFGVKVQDPPACVTVSDLPAIVIVPERYPNELGSTYTLMLPLELPEAPAGKVIHAYGLLAAQEQELGMVICTERKPPAAV